jgi:hypothetical protein
MEINVYNNSNDADSAYQLSNYLDNVPYGQIFFGVSVGDISNLWQTAYLGNLGLTFNDMNPFDSLVFIAKLGWPYLAVWDHSTNSSISASLDANLRGKGLRIFL